MSLTQIKEAIEVLSDKERAELNAWLQAWEDDDWDKQMKRDAAAGKFGAMVAEAKKDYHSGKCRPLP